LKVLRADKKKYYFFHKTVAELKKHSIFAALYHAKVAQLVERQPSKLNVASSNLVFRSKDFIIFYGVFFLCKKLHKTQKVKQSI
tara:strand:+ start:227 stop:478 length:252 start_codon:yes stop_codon:yes gene_type:complete